MVMAVVVADDVDDGGDGDDDDGDGDGDDDGGSYLCLAAWAEGKPGYRRVPLLTIVIEVVIVVITIVMIIILIKNTHSDCPKVWVFLEHQLVVAEELNWEFFRLENLDTIHQRLEHLFKKRLRNV